MAGLRRPRPRTRLHHSHRQRRGGGSSSPPWRSHMIVFWLPDAVHLTRILHMFSSWPRSTPARVRSLSALPAAHRAAGRLHRMVPVEAIRETSLEKAAGSSAPLWLCRARGSSCSSAASSATARAAAVSRLELALILSSGIRRGAGRPRLSLPTQQGAGHGQRRFRLAIGRDRGTRCQVRRSRLEHEGARLGSGRARVARPAAPSCEPTPAKPDRRWLPFMGSEAG